MQKQSLCKRVLRLQRVWVALADNPSAFDETEPELVFCLDESMRGDEQVAHGHAHAQMPPHQRRNSAQQNLSFTAVLDAGFLLLLLRFTCRGHCIFDVDLTVLQLCEQPPNHILQPKRPANVGNVTKSARFLVIRQNPCGRLAVTRLTGVRVELLQRAQLALHKVDEQLAQRVRGGGGERDVDGQLQHQGCVHGMHTPVHDGSDDRMTELLAFMRAGVSRTNCGGRRTAQWTCS